VAIPVDPVDKERYEDEIVKEKCTILDGVKDHVAQHISKKNMTKDMWDTLMTFYEGTFM